MAALLLSSVGASVGGAFGDGGKAFGRLIGAVAGNIIDQRLFAPEGVTRSHEGPRLSDLNVLASTEGAAIPRVYGRVRIGGELIWATALEEVATTTSETTGGGGQSSGGKGGPSGSPSPQITTNTTTYSYYANLAVGLSEGPIGHVTRVWADGKPLDLTGITMRVYAGTDEQTADPLIVAKEGADSTPAYRGTAYVVFERLPIGNFGNRIPQLTFEVTRPVGRLEQMVRAVTLIPGTTEFGYEPSTVVQVMGPGQSAPENRHVDYAASDVVASLDELQALCPKLERVAIVVAWFGNDLRAGHCVLQPGVDSREKSTHGATWSVAGLDRSTARLVSRVDDRPAFGGTPSDASVVHLIQELRARGIKITLYPFVMMDIPAGNALPDPWSDAAAQPAYPWRGRITCDPAPGRAGSPDGTATAAVQVDDFFGGTSDWGYRHMVRHYAELAASAGGVDAFLIGSELKALTRVRSGAGAYPMVAHLVSLAAEVKSILGSGTPVTYGADWTEYGAHVVAADASEVRFPLDPLWASDDIDAIGIDYYPPLSDWRDGSNNLDRLVADVITDRDYLSFNLTGGEAYDWYYADLEARTAQARSAITDGLGKPWIHRQKDLWSFWSNPHYERVGGAELGSPTAFVPKSKPIWLTEVGCPAVDKGSNQPSVFPDAKSSEGGFPYFSNGRRDDLIQRRYIECVLAAFDPDFGAAALNPASPLYAGRMVDPSAIHLWTWDARPYPPFPAATDTWSDGPNWETGHWLTGRLGSAPLEGLVSAILKDSGVDEFDTSALGEGADGYIVDRPMTARAAIEPLASAFAFDAAEQEGRLAFRPRGGAPVAELIEDDLVLLGDRPPFRVTRAQETELPREVTLGYSDGGADYRRAAARSRRLVVGSARVTSADVAMVTNDAAAERRAEIWLQDLWAGRESAEFALPQSALALTPGDVMALTLNGRRRLFEIREITDTEQRLVKARSIDPEVFDLPVAIPRRLPPPIPPAVGPVHALLLDLPALGAEPTTTLTRIAVAANPWPGPVAVWRSSDGLSFQRAATALAPATVGETLDPLSKGPTARFDRGSRIRVRLYTGVLSSVSDAALLNGANAAAVRAGDGAWEILQFGIVELVGERTYELSRFLRGQMGSEHAIQNPLPAGADFVLLDQNVVSVASGLDALERTVELRVIATSRDHGDPSAVTLEMTPHATALKPLSPVHLHARRSGSGVTFEWIRRSRIEADSWVGEVPLGEEREAYAIEILNGAAVVRTIETALPSAQYAAADEIADFGAAQANLTIRVAQLSATVGRGFAAQATLTP
jgi:hypothetical protein